MAYPPRLGLVGAPDRARVRNRLLATLPEDEFARLRSQLEHVALERGHVLVEPQEPIEHIYFPQSGITSVVALAPSGEKLEVGLFGWEGMSGTSTLLGLDTSPHQTFMQVAGAALRIPVARFRELLRQNPVLHEHVLRYVHVFTTQVAHTALASGSYSIGTRLARWLLMCHDRVDGDELPLTHDFIALMLGVRRPGVTEHLHILEGVKAIRAHRGLITVLDRAMLEEAAGESYGVPEAEYERVIGPFRARQLGAGGPSA